MINEVVDQVNKIVVALYGGARDQMVEYVSLDNTWPNYLNQVAQMIDALGEVRKWSPMDRTTLDNIVHLCKDNVEGYSFRDKFNNGMPVAHGISESYERLLRNKIDDAIAALRSIDPSYSRPTIEKKTADPCFIVTATMGDFNDPQVILLRQFRDDWILKKAWGRAFVHTYYRVGPLMAVVIERSMILRKVSFRLIVQPAARFARSRLRQSHK